MMLVDVVMAAENSDLTQLVIDRILTDGQKIIKQAEDQYQKQIEPIIKRYQAQRDKKISLAKQDMITRLKVLRSRIKDDLTLARIDQEIAKLQGGEIPVVTENGDSPDGFKDMLKYIRPKSPAWQLTNGELKHEGDGGPCPIAFKLTESYDIFIEFTFLHGKMLGLECPIKTRSVFVNFGGLWATSIGLQGTKKKIKGERIQSGHKYKAVIKVRMYDKNAIIEVLLDGKPHMKYEGPYNNLIRPCAVALHPWKSSFVIHSMKARPVKQEKK